jgi:hypothetical protein
VLDLPLFIDGQANAGGAKLRVADKYTGEPFARVGTAGRA